MAANQMEVFCVIDGEYSLFSIKIQSRESVSTLKDKIKETAADRFANIGARNLELYQVEISVHDDLEKSVEAKLSKNPTKLDAWLKLAAVFKDGPKDNVVHIIVKAPGSATPLAQAAAETTPPNLTVSLPNPLTPTREGFSHEVQLPLWKPLYGAEEVRSHITGLKIPLVSEIPSLLLHNLGEQSHDTQLVERIERLFSPGSNERFVCNTSGSGKTRLLLEGLWRNWGFYFTARTEPDRIGSEDLGSVLQDLKKFGNLKPLPAEHHDDVLTENNKVASHRSLLLLYARTFIFRVFLETVSAISGRITENHKKQWLLIQIAPGTLLQTPDVFSRFTRSAGDRDRDFLESAVENELSIIRGFLPQSTTLFCVLDEAQVPTNMFSNCFLSETEPAQPRPILREILVAWRQRLPDLIFSGTEVSMQDMESVLGSVLAKERVPLATMTYVGGFDNEVDQRAYLEQYLPPGFLETPLGKGVAHRVGYWLRGRHRFTATYISRLLRTGFESPHQVLNEFVHGMTGFRPSDYYDDLSVPVKLEEIHAFEFSTLVNMSEKKPDLLTTVASFVLEYTITGKMRGLGGPNGDKMVEFGLSRFKKSSSGDLRKAETDEPLAILGLVNFFEEKHVTLESHLRGALNVPDASARGIAFEPFGAYLIARAFSTPTPLSNVFKFVGESKLEDELAELVTLERTDGAIRINTLNLKSGLNLRPSHVLGCSPATPSDTLKWLQNPEGFAFCFPASAVGPDLIFFLRLTSDSTVLRVCVQFKHTQELPPYESRKAIRTTDPFNFFSQFKDNQWTISDLTMQLKMVEAIRNLGNGTKKAGDCGVLRVVVSHPAPVHDETLENAAENSHRHPLATISVSRLESKDSDLGQAIVGLAQMAGTKRKRPDEIHGTKSKKPNTRTRGNTDLDGDTEMQHICKK